MLAFALQHVKMKYRSGIAQGYLPHVVMFGHPDYFAPKQFSKMAEGSDYYACACVEFRFHLKCL